jgi:putative membrane protein
MDWYNFFKALHIIGFVSWFAGLFYLVRLFVYHREAWDRGETDMEGTILRKQYHIMESRLYQIIQTPALVLTLIGGIAMLIITPSWLAMPWMHLKLGLLLLLIIYHFSCGRQVAALAKRATGISSFGYRLYNEVPTLLLIAIVMLAVWKNLNGLWIGLATLTLLGFLFFIAAKLYKRKRKD